MLGWLKTGAHRKLGFLRTGWEAMVSSDFLFSHKLSKLASVVHSNRNCTGVDPLAPRPIPTSRTFRFTDAQLRAFGKRSSVMPKSATLLIKRIKA